MYLEILPFIKYSIENTTSDYQIWYLSVSVYDISPMGPHALTYEILQTVCSVISPISNNLCN